MPTIEKWSKADNYSGEDMSEYYVGPSRVPRECNALSDSNFNAALELLGGESETVQVHSFRHWLVGSFEQILVHESDITATTILQDIADQLNEYPVLDDKDHSRRELGNTEELWQSMSMTERVEVLTKNDESIFTSRANTAYDLYHRAEQTYYELQVLANE